MPVFRYNRYSWRPEDCLTAVLLMYEEVAPRAVTDPVLSGILNALDSAIADVRSALGSLKDNPLTGELEQWDFERDQQYSDLVHLVNGLTTHYDPEIAHAAQRVLRLFRKYGLHLSHDSYAKESAKIDALLKDLGGAEAKADIDRLDVGTMVDKLSFAQQEFHKIHKKVIDSKADETKPPVNDVMPRLRIYLHHLTNYVALRHDLDPEGWKKEANRLQEIITEFSAKAKARKTRALSEEEEETPPSAGDPTVTPPAAESTAEQVS